MSDDQISLQRLLDETSIRNTIARFAVAATEADYDSFRALWAEGATVDIGTPYETKIIGVDDIVGWLQYLWNGKEFFVQFATPGVIEIDGDEATASTICHEEARGPGETYYRTHGIFSDRLQRTTDGWVFANRTWRYLWLDTSAFAGDSFPFQPADVEI